MKKRNKSVSRIVRSSKAEKIEETYRDLGFIPADETQGISAAGSAPSFAPISFLPHIEYTVSSIVGGN